jgi:uncharacterized membrane protein YoaK (UPF0700 family)
MGTFVAELREIFVPERGSPHGPVAPLLLLMTFVTGLVDAFSYLVLGHVFVANMTGNVLFLAFALAGAKQLSVAASIVELVAFFVGAAAGGKLHALKENHRAKLLTISATVEALLVGVAMVLALVTSTPVAGGLRYGIVVVLALAMGVQNAASRKLAVPDLTTTVLTLTITGMGADSSFVGGPGARATRRSVAVATMLAGAFVGAILVLRVAIFYPLVIAAVGVASVALASRVLGDRHPEWS